MWPPRRGPDARQKDRVVQKKKQAGLNKSYQWTFADAKAALHVEGFS